MHSTNHFRIYNSYTKNFIVNHYLCNLMAFFCSYMTTSSYVLEQLSLTKTILILCLLFITFILVYSHFDIRGLAFNDYTVFNLPSSRVNTLMKEGLTEANIEFTVEKIIYIYQDLLLKFEY